MRFGDVRVYAVMRRAVGAVPAPLAALLVVVAIVGVSWALIVPPWQQSDSIAHFAYVQSLAERGRLPGTSGRPQQSTEQQDADYAVGATNLAFNVGSVYPSWSAEASATYARHPVGARWDGGGPNPESANPPLYYSLAAIPYRIDEGGDIFSRLYTIQLWGVLLLVATAVGGWLLAGEVLGRRRLPQLACAAVVSLVPMVSFDATSVNPDALLIPLSTLLLWSGARVINHGARQLDCVVLCGLGAATILTKATSYALLPAIAVALVLGWRRNPAPLRRAAARRISASLPVLAVPVLGWLLYTHLTHRLALNSLPRSGTPPTINGFLSYLWQFYLPPLPFMRHYFGQVPLYGVWIKEGWGVFGWLDVSMPDWLYGILAAITGAIAVGTLALLVRLRSRKALAMLSFLTVALGVMLAGLHWEGYRSYISGQGPLLQGRYLLPLIGIFGLAVGLLVKRLGTPRGAYACALLVPALLALQCVALGSIVRSYFA